MENKRVFLIVLDSAGVGELPDAAASGDEGSYTWYSAATCSEYSTPNMFKLGLGAIDGQEKLCELCKGEKGYKKGEPFTGSVMRLAECSGGKDTTVGHWEIAGAVSEKAQPTFPDGFPDELIERLEKAFGRKILCNKPYSGTEVIKDFGREHVETGALIVYTSADSVLQIAAHESVVPVKELYHYCELAREICKDEYAVGRIIARPFEGEWPYKRTTNRHDYSLLPPRPTMLNALSEHGFDVLGVGKIYDVFAGSGLTGTQKTSGNADGIEVTIQRTKEDFNGLCFTNLVDTDMLYGHRNDIDGYGKALTYFDQKLPEIMAGLRENDILMITADHGCDPGTPSTDHSREYIPLLIYGKHIKQNNNLGTRKCFGNIGATILEYFNCPGEIDGESFLSEIIE